MDMTMLYSDTAILIYEGIGILVLIFFIWKLKKEKKICMEQEEFSVKKNQEDELDQKLKNKRRREGK